MQSSNEPNEPNEPDSGGSESRYTELGRIHHTDSVLRAACLYQTPDMLTHRFINRDNEGWRR